MADDGIEITFEGLGQFDAMMVELAGPAAERLARRATRAGGRVFQAAITDAAPTRPSLPSGNALPPGALKNDIEVHVAKESDGSISAYVAPGKLTRHVARWVEYGHELVIGGKTVGHVPAYPFIRPAFESSNATAQDAVAISIASDVGGYQQNVETEEYGAFDEDDEGLSIGPGGE